MDEALTDFLLSEVRTGGQAYVRNVVAAEEAVQRGQFNVSKILRAAAFAQRTLAMNAARQLSANQDPAVLFGEIIAELEAGLALAPPEAPSTTARLRLIDMLRRSVASLAANSDVLEIDVDLGLMGCSRCGNIMEGWPRECDLCGALRPDLDWFGPYYSQTAERLGQLRPDEVVSTLAAIPPQVADLLLNTEDAVLSRKPTAGEWSAKEIVGHMIVIHHALSHGALRILQEDGLPDVTYKQAPWDLHEGQGYEQMTAAELVDHLERASATSQAAYTGLTPEQWDRKGLINGPRVLSLLEWGTYLANHDVGHLAQVRRLCQVPG